MDANRQNPTGQLRPESELSKKLNARLNRSENSIDEPERNSSKDIETTPQHTEGTQLAEKLNSRLNKSNEDNDESADPPSQPLQKGAPPIAAVRSTMPVPQPRRPSVTPRATIVEKTNELEKVFSQMNKDREDEE